MSRTIDALHKNLPLGSNHILHDGEYADAAARLAETAFTDDNVDKVYKQLDDLSIWRCTSQTAGVPAWERLGHGGGLLYFTETYDVTYDINGLSLVGNTDVGFCLLFPGGGGALITGAMPDGAGGGNARGLYATDLQRYRAAPEQVASGEGSFIWGERNRAGGRGSQAGGKAASDFGVQSKQVFGIDVISGIDGCSQKGSILLGEETFNATPKVLISSSYSGNNTLLLQDDQAMTFVGTCIAKKAGTTDIASWKLEGCIVRGTGVGSTTLVASTVTAISNVPGWTLALSADTTNGGLSVTFTGVAATNIGIVCNLETSEVIFA